MESDRLRPIAAAVRLLSHLAVWVCVLVPTVLVLVRGWSPIGDYAAIEVRTHNVFSLHPPLVGMYSTASVLGHTVFDPGPAMFWLLAIPVRLDPSHGLVWGAALLWGLALSLAIEALWRSGQWLGCALVALVVIDLVLAAPFVLENAAWNAYFPLPFFVLALVTAYRTANGAFGWWPVLVVAASVAAQAHLLYVTPSLALVLVAPAVGLLNHGWPGRWRWIVVGTGAGLLCWIAPLIQASNLAALLRGTGKPLLGFGFGLRLLGLAAGPSPAFLRQAPNGFFPDVAFAYSRPTAYGIAVVAVLVAVCVYAGLTRRRGLFALGCVALTSSLGVAGAFAIIPAASTNVVGYLLPVLWIIGPLVWITAAWCLAALLWPLVLAVRPALARRATTVAQGGPVPIAVGVGVLALSAICGLVALAMVQVGAASADFGSDWSAVQAHQVATVTSLVEHHVAKGPVNLIIAAPGTDATTTIATFEGIGAKLQADGWDPGLLGLSTAYSALPPQHRAARVMFVLRGAEVTRFGARPAP